ncbi:MAG: hypothetical protein NZM12_07965, partial [Steroidobacteraceae bacterium]|nr:hypothetical protein [Steroidobacteraceae bacterium]
MKEKLSDVLRIVNRKTGDRLRLDYVYGNVQLMLYDPVKRVDVRELSPRVNAGTMRAILNTIDNVFTYMMDKPVSRMRANP